MCFLPMVKLLILHLPGSRFTEKGESMQIYGRVTQKEAFIQSYRQFVTKAEKQKSSGLFLKQEKQNMNLNLKQ